MAAAVFLGADPGPSCAADIDDVDYGSPNANDNCTDAGTDDNCFRLNVHTATGGIDCSAGVTLLFFHAGGFTSGDRNVTGQNAPTDTAGCVAVTASYSLATAFPDGEASFPQLVIDGKRALKFVREVGIRILGWPDKVVVYGRSAGAYVALMVGLTEGVEMFEEVPCDPGVPNCYSADLVVSGWGPAQICDFQGSSQGAVDALIQADASASASPCELADVEAYIDADDPPVAFYHGDADTTVDDSNSIDLEAALDALGVSTSIVSAVGEGHGYLSVGELTTEVYDTVIPALLP